MGFPNVTHNRIRTITKKDKIYLDFKINIHTVSLFVENDRTRATTHFIEFTNWFISICLCSSVYYPSYPLRQFLFYYIRIPVTAIPVVVRSRPFNRLVSMFDFRVAVEIAYYLVTQKWTETGQNKREWERVCVCVRQKPTWNKTNREKSDRNEKKGNKECRQKEGKKLNTPRASRKRTEMWKK